jgi:hypothetical protein
MELKKIMRKFRKRYKKSNEKECCCPGTEAGYPMESLDKMCASICGTAWPELVDGLHTECPCHQWGHEEALKKLEEYIGPS